MQHHPFLTALVSADSPLGQGIILLFLFFFSSRRRHTRYWRDWSSDVCSSDLAHGRPPAVRGRDRRATGLGPAERRRHQGGERATPRTGASGPWTRGRRGGGRAEIGRASCRERVEISVVAVSSKKR